MQGDAEAPPLAGVKVPRIEWLSNWLTRVNGSGPGLLELSAAVALLAWPSLVIRTWLLVAIAPSLRVSDARGYLSDLGVAALLGAFAFLPWRLVGRALLTSSFLLVALVSLGNFEHVRANGSSFDVAAAYLLADGTFVRGSVFGVSALAQSALVFLPPLLAVVLGRRIDWHSARRVRLGEFALVLLAFGLFEAFVPVPNDRVHWRQQHPLTENAVRVWRRSVMGDAWRKTAGGPLPAEYKHLREQDLSGNSVLGAQPAIKNVLLVMIEGLSRGHIFSMRDERSSPGWLKNLGEFAGRHVDYTEYISLQRQTNRGEYSVLCGDQPNLVARDSEMDVYSATRPSERAECLPGFLERHGFKAVYLQAAPITFMGKDEFLPNAGFSSVLDTKWFSKAYSTSGWGVDDRAFFEQAGDLIRQLRSGGQPWFLSLLTVGTHHPYLIPPEWKGRSKTGAFEDSLLYLDAVLKQFFERLEKERVLDDTLVLITGDESAGYILENETAEMMSQHSVPLIVAYPGDRPERVEGRFAHSDLALSIADAIGAAESSSFHGRSVFRRYASERRLVFGNIYLSKLGAIGPGDELLLCERSLDACSGFQLGKHDHFLTDLGPRDLGAEEASSLKQAVLALDREVPTSSTRRVSLLNPGPVRLRPKDDTQLVFYGKYHDAPRPTRARVHIAVSATEGSTLLHHDIASAAGTAVIFDAPGVMLIPGMSLDWRYDLDLGVPVKQLEFRLSGYNHAQGDAVLQVEAADVEFVDHDPSEAETADAEPFSILPRRFAVSVSHDVSVNLLEQHGLLPRSGCVKEGAGAWKLEGCAEGAALVGPAVPLPAEVTVGAEFELQADAGSATASLEITAEQGRTVLGRSAPVALGASGVQQLAIKLQLSLSHADVETRLRLEHVAGLSASILKARLDVSP